MSKVIYPELSYEIVGIVFDIFNQLGYGYQEKYYQKAVNLRFKKHNLTFKEQVKVNLNFDNISIGRYFIDFVIDDKIVLELKVGNKLFKRDYDQVKAYLKTTSLKLGILVLFSKVGVTYKRVLNIQN